MYSNKEILDGLILCDQTIINSIYKKNYPVIASWITRNNGNSDDAADIIQDAFLIILRKLKKERIELDCSFSTYLFAICKHLWLKQLRDSSRFRTTELTAIVGFMEEESDKELEEKKFCLYLEMIDMMETRCRELLLLYCKKKSLTEIMQVMGFKNQQAVADKKKNCRKKLIENLLSCQKFKELQSEISVSY